MLYKNYHNLIIGRNYLSFIFGIELLRNNKRTLILDDKKTSYGPFFDKYLSEIDKDFLITWGSDHGVQCLEGIDRFLTPQPLRFVVDGRHLIIGLNPYENFRELCRKFPEFFFQDDTLFFNDQQRAERFNESYKSLTNRLAQVCFHFQGLESFSIDEFLSHYPKEIKETFFHFRSFWENLDSKSSKDSKLWMSFLYAGRGFFHKRLERSVNERDLFHLYLSLLSPHYKVHQSKLTNEIEKVYMNRGGSLKKTTVREWLFDNQKPWSIELSSYEGIIHPQHVSFFGGHPTHFPFKFNSQANLYRGACLSFHYDQADNDKIFKKDHLLHFLRKSALPAQRCVVSEQKSIGGDKSIWMIDFSKNHLVARSFVRTGQGMKLSFHQEALVESLENSLLSFWPSLNLGQSINELVLSEENEIWTSSKNEAVSTRSALMDIVQIVDQTKPSRKFKLKEVRYYGPSQAGNLGLLSTFMNMREGSLFL